MLENSIKCSIVLTVMDLRQRDRNWKWESWPFLLCKATDWTLQLIADKDIGDILLLIQIHTIFSLLIQHKYVDLHKYAPGCCRSIGIAF